MKAIKRYALVLISGVLLLLFYYGGLHMSYGSLRIPPLSRRSLRPFVNTEEINYDYDLHISPSERRDTRNNLYRNSKCRMETCFDFSLCRKGFKVYVYQSASKVSQSYNKILTSIRESRYYTSNPEEACVFVLSIDTLDRDKLSSEYVQDIEYKMWNLPHWNGGRNHIIFNLFSGSWPNYRCDDLDFNLGYAILAKASFTKKFFRTGFDISLPLFPKDHSQKGGAPGSMVANNVPLTGKYLLVFKGKRYLTGIGSNTRNALYHVHNGKDIILLTTCKHGKNWKSLMDSRCNQDNAEFEKYDYQTLLHNSTFCLVPRGRRLGSFRFLEALQAACIPILLSNGWELPFSEVIDWDRATIEGDERLLLQVPSITRSITSEQILSLRQQSQFLWETYFSSLEKIISTTFEIIKDRINRENARNMMVWNVPPGALAIDQQYSSDLTSYPFFNVALATPLSSKFTAVILATSPVFSSAAPVIKLIKNIIQSANVAHIVILWHVEHPLPPKSRWPATTIPLTVVEGSSKHIGDRFKPSSLVKTDAILNLDEDTVLTTDEIDFAFSVWKSFPERIVGYPARSHYWDESQNRWAYTSKWTNEYSMVLTSAAFYHRYYNHLYTETLPKVLLDHVNSINNCEDILMNFLVASVTHLPPVKVSQRKCYKQLLIGEDSRVKPLSFWRAADHFPQRQNCLNLFAENFGKMPLTRSQMRLDPLLYQDPVANLRRRYRTIELVNDGCKPS